MAINLSLITLDNVRDLDMILGRKLTDVEEKILELLMVKEDEEVIDDLRFQLENLQDRAEWLHEKGYTEGVNASVAILDEEEIGQNIIDRVRKL